MKVENNTLIAFLYSQRIMSSEIDNNLSSSANNLSSSVILKEEFDEGFEPTKEGKKNLDFFFLLMNEYIADFMNEKPVCECVCVCGKSIFSVCR